MEHKWSLSTSGYAKRGIMNRKEKINKTIPMHREIMNINDKREVDHINSNRLDNRKDNLRLCNRQQNCFNNPGYMPKSKLRGVIWRESVKKWQAYIKNNYKFIHIGFFITKEEAALAYNKMAIKLRGEFARLNII